MEHLWDMLRRTIFAIPNEGLTVAVGSGSGSTVYVQGVPHIQCGFVLVHLEPSIFLARAQANLDISAY